MLTIDIKGITEHSENLKVLQKEVAAITAETNFTNSVGQLLVSRAKQNLEDGGTDDKSYTLLSVITRKQKARKGFSLKPLQRTGLMRRSLNYKTATGKLQLQGLDIVKHHQYGAPRASVPQREVFTISKDDYTDIKDMITERLKNIKK